MQLRPRTLLAITALLALGAGYAASGTAATKPKLPSRAEMAQRILNGPGGAYLTSPARLALSAIAHNGALDQGLATGVQGQPMPAFRAADLAEAAAGVANARVNDPGRDIHQTDQTTQSETTVAVSGRRVVVGFNDSQQALLRFTAGADLSGYAYSTDGGASFTDGGAVPNAAGRQNLGDPWLAADRAGNFYYSTLASNNLGLGISVAKSSDGGARWAAPVQASPADSNVVFYSGDKDALTIGPAPGQPRRDVLYDTWDDFFFTADGNLTSGLPVARSSNGGQSWQLSYADKFVFPPLSDCSFQQYIGAQTLVRPDGTVHLVAERIFANDPTCTLAPPQFEQDMFTSTDGGQNWGPRVKIADVTPATPFGALDLAPGQAIRTIEFPTIAASGGTLYVGWNDGAQGSAHIRLAHSTDNGQTWALSWASGGSAVDLQPSLAADRGGIHLLYYKVTPGPRINVILADSATGASFTRHRVNSVTFPGVPNLPQFDPILDPAYMGDYLWLTASGGRLYMAWGDNRDTVTNFLWPTGRHDPDVFFAAR